MQQITNPTIRVHTINRDEGAYVGALVLTHNDNAFHLQGATADRIYVMTQGVAIYALSINQDRGYIGLQCFMAPESDPINTVFLHTHQEIVRVLGKTWEELLPETMVLKLIDYLI
ncbi:hypothetical protein GMSM_25890 [Geomonas sp. Red276]